MTVHEEDAAIPEPHAQAMPSKLFHLIHVVEKQIKDRSARDAG
jgi:hypothetical protein